MNRVFRMLLILVVILICAAPIFAQEVRGSFTLPFQATWGGAVLQPGPYTFTLDVANRGMIAIHRDGHTTYAKLGYLDNVKASDRRSEMVAVSYDQRAFVHELYVAELQTAYHFNIPKYFVSTSSTIQNAKVEAPEVFARVPVAILGK